MDIDEAISYCIEMANSYEIDENVQIDCKYNRDIVELLQELKTRRETHPNITAIREYSIPDGCYLCSKCGCVCYGDYDYCISCGAKLGWE